MGKRADFYSKVEEIKDMPITNNRPGNSSVDRTVDNLKESYGIAPTAPATEKNFTEFDQEVRLRPGVEINVKPRETDKVHKNFFFPKTLCNKISILAKQKGISENALVYEILNNAFE